MSNDLGMPGVTGTLAKWRARATEAWRELRHQKRRVWQTPGRAHIELRDLDRTQLRSLTQTVVPRLEKVEGVKWARVNPFLRRVVVAIEGEQAPIETLISMVDEAEVTLALHGRPFADGPLSYPGDLTPLRRTEASMVADVVGAALGLARRALGWVSSGTLEIDAIALLAVIDNVPAARRAVEKAIGTAATDLTMTLAGAFITMRMRGVVGPVVSLAQRWLRLQAQRHRRELWARWEPTLCGEQAAHDELLDTPAADARPLAVPDGKIENYAQRAVIAALGALGVGMASTRSLQRASSVLFAALPRPAREGRDAFTQRLMVQFAQEGLLTLNPGALSLLDRLDAVVLPGELLGDARPEGEPITSAQNTLATAVRRTRLKLVIVTSHPDKVAWARPHEVVAPDRFVSAVRRLQGEGHVVLSASGDARDALLAADLGVGLVQEGRPAPWGADLMVPHGIPDLCAVLMATRAARRTAAQSVEIAQAGLVAGWTLSMMGLNKQTTYRTLMAASMTRMAAMANGVRLAYTIERIAPQAFMEAVPWHTMSATEVMRRLETSPRGLPELIAHRRRPTPTGTLRATSRLQSLMLDELINPLTPVLAAGAGLSTLMGEGLDGAMITAVMALNALVGAGQRFQIEAMLDGYTPEGVRPVRVRRPTGPLFLRPEDLAPGDIIELGSGEVVPADCRIAEDHGLEVDESSMTGESLPVRKNALPTQAAAVAERTNMLYSGTIIAAGTTVAIVTAVGDDTEVRRATLAAGDPPTQGVEARLESLTEMTGPAALVSGLLVMASGMLQRRDPVEYVNAAVSLAVAAVPEGLPMLATAAQLAAAHRLGQRGAIVRNPRSVEALGRVDVLCADKTGTLTQGRIKLRFVHDGERRAAVDALDASHRTVVAVALRASDPPGPDAKFSHMTDQAIYEGATERGLSPDATSGSSDEADADVWERLDDLPFEPGRGYHATKGRIGRRCLLSVKGSPESVIAACTAVQREGKQSPLDDDERAALMQIAESMAARGLRLLAVAERAIRANARLQERHVQKLVFKGFLGLADAIRPTSKDAVASLQQAGVRVLMVTGDHPSTAAAIADELGLGQGKAQTVLTGTQLRSLDDAALAERLNEVTVIARATPRQKVRIVKALQSAGHTVGMTGDGANDAPAIRLADVGIALGARSTPAARYAADMVVTDGHIETIVHAALEGRAMWASVREAVALLVGGNLGEIGFTLVGGLAGGRAPLNTRQLLLVNLLTDTLPAIAIALRPVPGLTPEQLASEGPEASLGNILSRDIRARAAITTSTTSAAWVAARFTGTRARANTVGMLTLVGSQLGQMLAIGRSGRFVKLSALGSAAFLLGITQTPVLSHFFGCRPLGPLGLTQVGVASSAAAAISLWRQQRQQRQNTSASAEPTQWEETPATALPHP